MVKAWNKNQLREIKATLGRFLAIFGIVALGVGFFAGLKVTQPAMLLTGSEYAQQTALFDLRLISTLGLTQEDVAYFSDMPGVAVAEGANSVDLTAQKGDRELTLKALSLSDQINKPALSAGRMPRKIYECIADDQRFSGSDIGKKLTVTSLSRDGAFRETELVIVGLASSSLYMNINRGTTAMGGGSLDGFLFVPTELFTSEYFTDLYIRLEGLDRQLYSQSYDNAIADCKPTFSQALTDRAKLRFDSIIGAANDALDEVRQQYEEGLSQYLSSRRDAEQQLAEALQKITDGAAEIEANRQILLQSEQELAAAEEKLAQGKKEYAEGLAEYEKQKSDAEKQLAEAQAEIDKNKLLLEQGMAQAGDALCTYNQLLKTREQLKKQLASLMPGTWVYNSVNTLLRITEAVIAAIEASSDFEQLKQLLEGPEQLRQAQEMLDAKRSEAEAEFAAAKAKLDAAAREIADGEIQIQNGKQEIAEGKQALSQAELELAAGQEEYDRSYAAAMEGFAEAEQELAEGKKAIDDAQLEIEKLEHPNVYLLDRETNAGYLSFQSDSGIVDGIAKVFPLFFFLVAAFVCITTMTRMVDEQRTQIGTLKALGYSDRQISAKYMLYSGSAALAGAVAGFALGTRLFPWVIWKCYDILYGFAPLSYYFSLPMALISLAAALFCSVGTTWAACRTELSRMPAQLMRPKAPKAGKRIMLEHLPILWNRFSFLYKVSIRNIVRYKKRLFMMLIGIGGCTALIVTGCGIRDSIANIAAFQFEEVTHYDVSVTFSVPLNETHQQEFRDRYPEMEQCVFLGYYAYESVHAGGISTVYVIATDDEALTETISMHYDGKPTAFPRDGAVIDATLAETLGIGIGDSIAIRVNDTKTAQVPVAGFFDNHLYHYAIMSAESYRTYFGEECEYQTAYITTDGDPYDLGSKLMEYPRTGAVSVLDALRSTVDNMMQSLNAMVFVVIGSACALAFIVIYNLTNITINERIREIATIKVLGFYPQETASYVSREIMMLTLLGAVVGLGLGKALHRFVMDQIVMDMVSFNARILPLSYLLAFVITIVMELVTGLLLRGKIEKINMAESLKSVE